MEVLKHHTEFFLKLSPFHCDLLTSDEHADMRFTVGLHHSDAYFNFVIEGELVGPVRLTEKVFKAIKNCQPFVIAGAQGSIQQLREMGYRTFDSVVDHSYDSIEEPYTTLGRSVFGNGTYCKVKKDSSNVH